MDLRMTSLQVNSAQQQPDSQWSRFYERLADIRHSWTPLEDVHYKMSEFGLDFELSKVKEVQKWPEFDFFHITVAKNGGPIAMMIKDKVLFIGQKEIKSMIFVFSAFGKHISTINLPEKLKTPREKLQWAFLSFTQDEDLCLISADGSMYILDPLTGEDKEKPINLGTEFQQRGIIDGKMFDNSIVFRNSFNQFYWISNLQNAQATKFEFVSQLQQAEKLDYLLVPKGQRGLGAPDLLVTDPFDGFWVISENKTSYQVKQVGEAPFGTIKYMALNAKKDLLALYAQPDVSGRIIVMKADRSAEYNRLDTGLTDARSIDWCGNDAPVLTYPDQIVIVGPREYEKIDLSCKLQGIKCMNEIDGLRIITSEKTYFLERVHEKLLTTFKVASISPSAKLIQAQKSVDLNQPKADDIINDLGKNLITGIEDLLECATCEHVNVPVVKHLLRTAGFAKTFPEAVGFDSNIYVEKVKTIMVLSKIRNSPNCSRAITYKQFEKFKSKNILKLMLKFRDYRLALMLIEQLNLKQYISMVYEEWCQSMIRYSTLSDEQLEMRLQDKFDMLKIKIAEEQGLSVQNLQYNLSGVNLTQQQRDLFLQGKGDSLPDLHKIVSRQLPSNIKLNIDFTKLAKNADNRGRKNLANFLIKQEKSIVKKIPFLLEAGKFEDALTFAIEGGDPNIINKVFTEIINKKGENSAVECAMKIKDGSRFLRNYAKARQNFDLLRILGTGVLDYSYDLVHLKTAYETSNLEARNDFFRQTAKHLTSIKEMDDFYAKMIEESIDVQDRQRGLFRVTKDPAAVDCPLANFYYLLNGKDGEQMQRDMYKQFKMPEKYHFMMCIRALAKQGKWEVVKEYIQMKKPPVTYQFLVDVCMEQGKKDFARDAALKITDYDEKIPILIDIEYWREAIQETYAGKRQEEYLDQIRAKAAEKRVTFIDDFIQEEEKKRVKK